MASTEGFHADIHEDLVMPVAVDVRCPRTRRWDGGSAFQRRRED